MMKLNIQLFATKKVTENYYKQAWGGRQQTYYHDSNTFLWIIKVWSVSQSIDTNKTTIKCGLYENGTWGSYSSIHSVKGKLEYRIKDSSGTWGGWKTLVDTTEMPSFTANDEIYAPFTDNDNSKKKFTSSLTLSHNADGTSQHFQLKATISVGNIGQQYYYAPWDASVTTDELYFETIPRASKINSATTTKTAVNFNYTRYTTSFTDTVTIKCGNTTLYTLENPLDSAITGEITKALTQSDIDTIVALGNANNLTQVPIDIETKTMNGVSPVGNSQTVMVNYALTNSTLEAGTSYSITNNAISITPVFTQLSASNLKHNLILTYGTNNGSDLTYTFENISSGSALALPINDPNIVGNLFERFRTSSSIDIRLTLVTQLNSFSTNVGSTSSKTLTLTLPSYTITGAISSITENASMPTGLSKASNTFIKNLSEMSIGFAAKKTDDDATSFYGTSIQYKVGNTPVSTPYIHPYDGTVPTIVAFTDLNDEVPINISGCNYVNYQFPTCSVSAVRSDSQGEATQTGNCVKFVITIIYFKEPTQGALITQYPHSTPEFTLQYQEIGQSSWTSFTQSSSNVTVTTSIDGNIVTKVYTNIVAGMNYSKQLNYKLNGEDCLKQSIAIENGKVIPGKAGIFGYKNDTTAENYTGINDHFILNGDMQVAVTSQHTGKNIIQGSSNHNSTYTNTLPAKSGTFAMTDDHDSTKQDKLVDGVTIKTINNNPLLGSGDITIQGAETTDVKINSVSITNNAVADIKTKSAYNASTNKIATESDIPTVNNAKLTITKNGNDFIEFTANASSNVSGNIDIPAKVSDLTNDLNFTSNTGTITGVSVNGTSIATSGVANISSLPASILSGAIANGVTATTQSVNDNSTKVATTAYVDRAIDNLPEPMVFKGSLGTGGTITSLPTASSSNEGYTYKVITAGTYASQSAKIGDTFISDGSSWVLIPSGDEPSGTVTSITIKATSPISIDSSSAITSSGTRTLSHANSGVTAGTYKSVTVNATGHVTGGTNPTTLSGYGITDAKINNGVITLGSDSITPLTSFTETDPIFTASAAHGITSTDITNWNNKSTFSGDYNDLTNKPTIPTVNNATLTIQKNGTTVNTFTANASSNVTANITVPTKTSDLTNDDNVVKDASYVHTDNNYTTTEKNKLSGIASGAEVNVQSDWNQTTTTADDYIKNKPTIPTVNNGTLTIQKNGTTVNTFTANSSSNITANIVVPTKTSDLTNDSNFVVNSNTYINTHPENGPVIIPFINNDIAFFNQKGGSYIVKYDGVEQSQNINNAFDASPSYWAINPTGTTEIVIELTLHKSFGWTNTIYYDFGAASWRAKNIKVEVMNSNYTGDTWVTKQNLTNYGKGNGYVTTSHTPVGADNAGAGFNKIRFTFSSWQTATGFRIAQLGIYNYGSNGVRETFMSRGRDDEIYRGITPGYNNTYTLGTSSKKWNNIYATTFTGNVTGNVTGNLTGTATKATGDKNGNDITTTYVSLSGAQTITGAKTFNADVDFNKNEAKNFVIQKLSSAPTNPETGQLYYNTNTGTIYSYANGGWVDILETTEPTDNYNLLFNRPITNLEGTTDEPLDLSSLTHGTYRIMGEYKYDSSDTTKSTDGALVLVFGQDSETKRIIFGESGVIIGNGTIENGKFKSLLPIVTTSSVTANSTNINSWKTELVDDVLVEYYGG